jgi:hypothetical protein
MFQQTHVSQQKPAHRHTVQEEDLNRKFPQQHLLLQTVSYLQLHQESRQEELRDLQIQRISNKDASPMTTYHHTVREEERLSKIRLKNANPRKMFPSHHHIRREEAAAAHRIQAVREERQHLPNAF